MTESPRSSLKVAALLAALAVMLLLLELTSAAALKLYIHPNDRSAFYEPPVIERERYELYLRQRDPVLGWPFRANPDGSKLDDAGSRPIPSFPEPGNECVSTFGDSFTYGDEVGHAEAWSNVLSELLDCRVANFGVGGYGTDQALIRFRQVGDDPSQLAVLGILPHNLMRNVNQYRYFLTGSNVLAFKPRFILSEEGLTLVRIPGFDFPSLTEALADPAGYFEYETFIPESEFGPLVMSFPYTRVFLKYLLSERVRYYISGSPGWRGFVSEGHPSKALDVTAGIVSEFAKEADARGKRSLVVTFPTARSYETFVETGEISYQDLLDRIEAAGMAMLDLHVPMREYLGQRRICALLTDSDNCVGHFNSEGNEFVARSLFEKVIDENLVAVGPR